MKRSRQVVLLITSSVVLTACNPAGDPVVNTNSPTGTGLLGGTNLNLGATPLAATNQVVHRSYPWYHPFYWFGGGSSRGSHYAPSHFSRSHSSSPSRSTPSRSGFGTHRSSPVS